MVTHDVLESDVGLFLIQCLLIIILSRMLSWLFAKVQQPPVIAEIISGILLGPTAFGKIPGFTQHLFPAASLRILSVFAQIGLIFFMFIIGLELDPTLFKSQIRNSVIISFVSIVFPFGLGLAASLYMAELQGTEWTYSLGIFIGVALCITAFPVLARILASKKLLATPIGGLSIACAAINDICGWVLLGLSVSLAGGAGSLDTLWTLLAAAGFVAIMLVIVRPLLLWAVGKVWRVDPNAGHPPSPSHLVMSLTVVLLFISSWCTEIIGIHAMFGAFTLGTITPKIGGFNQAITEKIEDLILVFLLPLYFVVSGLRTDLTTLNTGRPWLGVLLIVSCACVGKIVGAGLTAKILKKSNRDAISLGILMNTRGLVELIVLNLGLDFGIIHTQVFGIMVLMAVFTTIMTSPLISLVIKREKPSSANNEFTVVLCTPTLSIGPSLVDLGYTIGNKISVSPIRRKKLKKIYLLSISEVNERPSDFIGQIRKDISKSTYQHLIQQGAHMKMKVAFNSIVTDSDHLTKEVIQFTELKGASMLILGEESLGLHHGRGGMIGKDTMWSLIKNSVSHVGVFTDKSGARGAYHRFKRILVAYLGGKNPNDFETLELANRMAETDGVTVTIIVFDNEFYWKHKKKLIENSSTMNLPLGAQEICNINEQQDPNNNNQQQPISILKKSGQINNPEILSPDGVDQKTTNESMNNSSSTNLSKTTEIYDPAKIEQHQSHLEQIVYGKNSNKINVIYRPKKQRQKMLLEQCINYDLLVVPYEQKRSVPANSPFPSFHMPGIDMMRKSLSMVHLPGRRGELHQKHFDEEMDVISPNQVEEGYEDFSDHPHLQQSQGGSRKNSTNQSSKNVVINQSINNNNNLNNINNNNNQNNVVDQRNEINSSSESSISSGNEHSEEPYWVRCPISTLVVYHRDTIPTHPNDDQTDNKEDGMKTIPEEEMFDDVKQVDPSPPQVVGDNTPDSNHQKDE